MRLIFKPFAITGGPCIISHGCHQQLEHRLCPGAAPHSESRQPGGKRLCLPAEHQRSLGHGLPWSQRRHGSSDGSGQTEHCLSRTLSFALFSRGTWNKQSYKSTWGHCATLCIVSLRALVSWNEMSSLTWNNVCHSWNLFCCSKGTPCCLWWALHCLNVDKSVVRLPVTAGWWWMSPL